MDAKTTWTHGFNAGYDGTFSALLANRDNDDYCRGFAAGRARWIGEHHSTCVDTFNTPNMLKSEDMRKVKGFNG